MPEGRTQIKKLKQAKRAQKKKLTAQMFIPVVAHNIMFNDNNISFLPRDNHCFLFQSRDGGKVSLGCSPSGNNIDNLVWTNVMYDV